MYEHILMEEWFVMIFTSFMVGHAVISIQNWIEKDRRTDIEKWEEEYKEIFPTVWI